MGRVASPGWRVPSAEVEVNFFLLLGGSFPVLFFFFSSVDLTSCAGMKNFFFPKIAIFSQF